MNPLITPRVPFDPARVPFFYGWVVVAASTLGVLASIPGQTMGVSVFTDGLLEETGLSRLGLANAYLVGTLGSAVLLPGAGRMLDRVGVRVGAMAAAMGLGGVLFAFAWVGSLVSAVQSVISTSQAAFGVLVVLFVGVRFTGQGVLTLASRTMLARWFERRRGLATAVSGLFVAFGFAIAPRILDGWIDHSGFVGAYRELAVVEIVMVTGLAFLLFREDPASSGLRIDGETLDEAAPPDPPRPSLERGQALRTRAFWLLTLSLALQGLVITGVTFHIVDLGAEQGLDRLTTVGWFVPMAFASTISEAIAGWASDRMPMRRVLQTYLVAITVGYAACTQLGSTGGYFASAVALGAAGGLFSVLATVAMPRFFGLRHLAAINGASMTAIVVGSALGPSVLAVSRTWAGSYTPALLVCATIPVGLALWTLRPIADDELERPS